jgi:holo-[acyl-carrier protein] synthase
MIIGIGVDIIEIQRVREVLERQKDRFRNRVFTPAEQQYCEAHRDPAPHFAVRFAAKEALFKALGTGWSGGIRWTDAEVSRAAGQAPALVLHGEAARMGSARGAHALHVTLSHSRDSAIAMVLIES